MHTPGPIDVQCGVDTGCRMCHEPADTAYVLCTKHQRLARFAPKLLEALEAQNGALTPYLEALRTSHLSMNRIEQAIYDAAIEARAAIAEAKGE